MRLTDEGAADLKKWIVSKLEKSSDADSDVLADYVLALIRVDTPDQELRLSATAQLEDFLKDDTAAFVNEIFMVVHLGSYKPGYVPLPTVPGSGIPSGAPSMPAGAWNNSGAGRGSTEGFPLSKKRSYNDIQENENRGDLHYARGDRQMKQMRRGGRGGRSDGFAGRGGRGGHRDLEPPISHSGSPPLQQEFANLPKMPTPPGLPFNPNDPLTAMMTLQAMGFPSLPGMPPFPQASPLNGQSQSGGQVSPTLGIQGRGEPCRDYETRGYCARGDACPYEHGTDRLVVPGQDEYDPKNALMGPQQMSPTTNGHNTPHEHRLNGHPGGQGRGRGDRHTYAPRRQNNRAEFSHAGPNQDRSITTIVVEQIPEEKFEEQYVRDFFSDFGNVVEVTMQPYKRLALVKYDDYYAAKQAYESPKVIFDNRFVKVYWYKPNALPTPPSIDRKPNTQATPKEEDQPFDKEEFERNAQIAQKKLEEKKAQMKEIDLKKQALEKQKEELAQRQAEEKRKLLEKLAAKGAVGDDVAMTDVTINGTPNQKTDSKVSAHTQALRDKVAELEAEAKSLGLDAALSDYTPRGRGRGRGRGSYRGWEGFATPFRGSPRGRGGFRGRVAASGYNLDLRLKSVAISGAVFDEKKGEALREYLIGIGEYEDISSGTNDDHAPNSDVDTLVIRFKDRATAETFMYGSKEIPNVGKLEYKWHSTPLQPKQVEAAADGDVGMGGTTSIRGGVSEPDKAAPVDDYDVAEDYDVADDIS